MRCAWKELLSVLPAWLRTEVDALGKDGMQELRLWCNGSPELVLGDKSIWLNRTVTQEDIHYCINTASRYSPWAAVTISNGYITAPGGHRIGICGEAVCRDGRMETVRSPTSLCIRVARDFPGISARLTCDGSLLIIGAPGWGKTTLLRDWIRNRSDKGEHLAVVDERGELFPKGFPTGSRTDILTGCPKPSGISMLLRTMGPSSIAVDEITDGEDCTGLLHAYGCGVKLYATAHASSLKDFQHRKVYRPLIENMVFQNVCVLHSDKSWHLERMA